MAVNPGSTQWKWDVQDVKALFSGKFEVKKPHIGSVCVCGWGIWFQTENVVSTAAVLWNEQTELRIKHVFLFTFNILDDICQCKSKPVTFYLTGNYLWKGDNWIVFIDGLFHKQAIRPFFLPKNGCSQIISENKKMCTYWWRCCLASYTSTLLCLACTKQLTQCLL